MSDSQRYPAKFVAVMALARRRHGVSTVSTADLYDLFLRLNNEFPRLMPRVSSRELFNRFLHGHLLGATEEVGMWFSIDSTSGVSRLEISEEAASRNLEHVLTEYGQTFVRPLEAVAERFAALVEARRTPAA